MLSVEIRNKIEKAVRTRITEGKAFCRGEFSKNDCVCALGALGFESIDDAAWGLSANASDLTKFTEGFDYQVRYGQNPDRDFGADMARMVYESGVQFEDYREESAEGEDGNASED